MYTMVSFVGLALAMVGFDLLLGWDIVDSWFFRLYVLLIIFGSTWVLASQWSDTSADTLNEPAGVLIRQLFRLILIPLSLLYL
ncbi:hypothetical protein RZS08_32830, partial [Arthrospira platensis SPKY1]|nr:hypothetical protein [Arthrospira platensis SPKY1]